MSTFGPSCLGEKLPQNAEIWWFLMKSRSMPGSNLVKSIGQIFPKNSTKSKTWGTVMWQTFHADFKFWFPIFWILYFMCESIGDRGIHGYFCSESWLFFLRLASSSMSPTARGSARDLTVSPFHHPTSFPSGENNISISFSFQVCPFFSSLRTFFVCLYEGEY